MSKEQLLALEQYSNLTVSQLFEQQPALANSLRPRLDAYARKAAASYIGGSDALRHFVETTDLSLADLPAATMLRDAALLAAHNLMRRDPATSENEELRKDLDTLGRNDGSDGADVTVADALSLNAPLASHPEFQRDLAIARVYRLADARGLNDGAAETLATSIGDVTTISNERLRALVADGTLSHEDARAAGVAVSFYHVLDERPELVAAASAGLDDVRQLASHDRASWMRIIRESGTTPPAGLSVEDYSTLLQQKVARIFPSDALASRVGATDPRGALKDNAALARLRALNAGTCILATRNFDALEVGELSAAEIATARARYDGTLKLVDRYPGMKLADVLESSVRSASEQSREVRRRVALVHDFFARNRDFLTRDLGPRGAHGDAFTFAGKTTLKDRLNVLATARAYQRAFAVAADAADTAAIVAGGFHSAVALADAAPDAVERRTGLAPRKAAAYRGKARKIAAGVTARAGSILDLVRGGLAGVAVKNVTVPDFLKEIPGFADFFGSQDFCNCTHCGSILSPAAYFVDLMDFIEHKITQPSFPAKPTHPLRLQSRRPDLWELPLTCANTETPIPYLVIINEILENAVAKEEGFTGDFKNRPEVEAAVYRGAVSTKVDSFQQPLHLALKELRTYLRHFDLTLADIADAGGATGDARARLYLGLSPREYELVTQSNNDLVSLRRIYDIQFSETAGRIEKFDAQLILPPMDVDARELDDLIQTRFVSANGATTIRIVGEKRTADSVQNDIQRVDGLTRDALDRLHRFTRLWRATGWRIGELDLVLTHAEQEGIGAGLSAPAARAVARVDRLRGSLDIGVEDAVVLWSLIPREAVLRQVGNPDEVQQPAASPNASPISPDARLTTPLFDRLFNPPGRPSSSSTWPQVGVTLLHPALATAQPTSVDPALARVQAGLGLDDDSLYQLIVGLSFALGIDPSSADDTKKQLALTHRNLSLLYRHARLAKLLRLNVPDLLAVVALTPEIPLGLVAALDDLEALLDFHTWRKSTAWSVGDLTEIVRPGTPAVFTSRAPLAGTAGGQSVDYNVTRGGQPIATATVGFATNTTLAGVVADWNTQAQHCEAYVSDSLGLPAANGTYLSIRTTERGSDVQLTISADSASIFTAALPTAVTGSALVVERSAADVDIAALLASQIVQEMETDGSLVFADTVFAALAPWPPIATSRTAVASTPAGQVITYTASIHGRGSPAETVTFAANATLNDVVADWNKQARATRAYRSDADGVELPTGDRLAIRVVGGGGSDGTLTITADASGLFAGTVPRTYRGVEVTEQQSRAMVSANAGVFEAVGATGRLRLADSFDPTTPPTIPASVSTALGQDMVGSVRRGVADALRAHHTAQLLSSHLPGKLGATPDAVARFTDMLQAQLSDRAMFRELRGDVRPPTALAALIVRLQRLAKLFAPSVFDADRLAFIQANRRLFEIDDFDRVGSASIRRVDLMRSLLARQTDAGSSDLLDALRKFTATTHFAGADIPALAKILGCDVALLRSIQDHLVLRSTPFEALEGIQRAIALASALDISGAALAQAQSTDYDEVAAAAAAVRGAFRAKYADEHERETKEEPFRDALLSRRRDALVAYLIHSSRLPFDTVNDLYHYYLLDVQLEGCARTSRVAAAIDSLQLYVNRCRMNLEETPPGHPDPVHVRPEAVTDSEWAWRQHYRFWEASRKIFLYPENYLEPEIRDDKTPLFKTLENELLAKEVTEETILEAYGRYLRGFDEVAHLAIGGSYHEKDDEARRDVLHLLGVTADEPPAWYYRRVENAHYGVSDWGLATVWGAWVPIDVQIPVRKVAPIVHQGQLYLFWVRYTTRSLNEVRDGNSRFVGYQHRAVVEFTRRKLDGGWTAPQRLKLMEEPFKTTMSRSGTSSRPTSGGDGAILDPLVANSVFGIDLSGIDPKIGDLRIYLNWEPLYDNVVHEVAQDDYTLRGFMWDQLYPGTDSTKIWLRGINFQMWSPVDLYRRQIGKRFMELTGSVGDLFVRGVPWLDPAALVTLWGITGGKFDLTNGLPHRLVWSRTDGVTTGAGPMQDRRILHSVSGQVPCFESYAFASIILDEARIAHFEQALGGAGSTVSRWKKPEWDLRVTTFLRGALKPHRLADIPPDMLVDVVNGSVGDIIVQNGESTFYLQHGVRSERRYSDGKYHLRRLGSTISGDIADTLYTAGLETLLSTSEQLKLQEHPTDLNLVASEIFDATFTGPLFPADAAIPAPTDEYAPTWHSSQNDGAIGVYLREIYFHIPFLIANHLNSQGKYEAAEHWYRYIFDPTASETITGLDPNLTADERKRRELDRNWRYREFRGLTPQTLRSQLTNVTAIVTYQADPFNPFAIARLRISAFQKAIVMKYVDNLIDWGDDLFRLAFSQLNPEYLREATSKYVTAQELLGRRPARLGDCGEGKLDPRTYPNIAAALANGSEFLMEVETATAVLPQRGAEQPFIVVNAELAARASSSLAISANDGEMVAPAVMPGPGTNGRTLEVSQPSIQATLAVAETSWIPSFTISFVKEISPVFCVPENDRMMEYWDRVEQRLYRLRHCQDIDGVSRQLPLFAPPIDPGLLARARAAGLGLDDILTAIAGDLPPYRFSYLVERAKNLASSVQSLGTTLLAALEKRDVEELSRIREVHQKNILALTSELRENELKAATEALEGARRRQAAAEQRRDHYNGLLSARLLPEEGVESAVRISGAALKHVELSLNMLAAIGYLVPNLGSPFSMNYGGKQVGDSAGTWSKVIGDSAGLLDVLGTLASIKATYDRREQEWRFQRDVAQKDVLSLQKDVVVAEIHQAIASRAVEIHNKTTEQQDEILEYLGKKLTGVALYTHLSRSLQRLHREAYINALAVGRLAERAYRFERPSDSSTFVGGEWDTVHAGLLAGEQLMLGLQRMDRRFIETDSRELEVNQAFSLAQLDPAALVTLREAASCDFAVPELYFDLFYPGHYRRRLRGVRLTIPCVTGSYTNVSAKLTLLESQIRREPRAGPNNLFAVPLGQSPVVAMSSAQADAGVFDLNFRDERRMPFEGAGAVSRWRLDLPKSFRVFDYGTISDVILQFSYTAVEDAALRDTVESTSATLEGALVKYMTDNALTRVFSLRHEFPTAFNRLAYAPLQTAVTIEIGDVHLPLFMKGRTLKVKTSTLVVVTADRGAVGTLALTVNNKPVTGFSAPVSPPSSDDAFGGLSAKKFWPTTPASAAADSPFAGGLRGSHIVSVTSVGTLGGAPGSAATLDPHKAQDVLLVVEYGL